MNRCFKEAPATDSCLSPDRSNFESAIQTPSCPFLAHAHQNVDISLYLLLWFGFQIQDTVTEMDKCLNGSTLSFAVYKKTSYLAEKMSEREKQV